MKTFSAFVVTLALMCGTANAQDILGTMNRLRANYGQLDRSTAGEFLNAVAWEHRADGVALLGKKSGNNCDQPRTGVLVSCDFLVNRITKRGADVLIAWDAAGTPVFNGFHEDMTEALANGSRTLVDPVSPKVVLPPPPDPTLVERIRVLESQLAQLTNALAHLSETTDEHIRIVIEGVASVELRLERLEQRVPNIQCEASANLGFARIPVRCTIK